VPAPVCPAVKKAGPVSIFLMGHQLSPYLFYNEFLLALKKIVTRYQVIMRIERIFKGIPGFLVRFAMQLCQTIQ
jgi:hypothetical protein